MKLRSSTRRSLALVVIIHEEQKPIVLVICMRQADAPISSCGDVKSDTFFGGCSVEKAVDKTASSVLFSDRAEIPEEFEFISTRMSFVRYRN